MIYTTHQNAILIKKIKKIIITKSIKRVILINIFYNLYKGVKKNNFI